MRVISGKARGTILHSIDNENTRPTLDRVKESLFNIINNKIDSDSVILDLFAGSGAIGIEFLRRGANKVYFNDYSRDSINMLKKNLEKTRMMDKSIILNNDYLEVLNKLKSENIKFDVIYLDPPYKEKFIIKSLEKISEFKFLKDDGIIIAETDEEKRVIEEINNSLISFKIYDTRKYGRAYLIFLDERGKWWKYLHY